MVTIRGSTITPTLQPQTRVPVSSQNSQSSRLAVSVPMLVPTSAVVRKPQTLAPKVCILNLRVTKNEVYSYNYIRLTYLKIKWYFFRYNFFFIYLLVSAYVEYIFCQQIITQSTRAPFTVQSIPVSVNQMPSALTVNKKTGKVTVFILLFSQNVQFVFSLCNSHLTFV